MEFHQHSFGAHEAFDWKTGVLIYRRKKLGPFGEPAHLTIGCKLRELLQSLPRSGELFPSINANMPARIICPHLARTGANQSTKSEATFAREKAWKLCQPK